MNFWYSRRLLRAVLICAISAIVDASATFAQTTEHSVEIGAQSALLRLNEFEITDVGVGIDAAWHLTPQLAVDATMAWFPSETEFETDSVASQYRVLGLVGARSGITQGRFDIYGRGRVGVLRFGEQDSRICTLIFPATVGCRLASGYTALAADVGGGVSTADGRRPVAASRRYR